MSEILTRADAENVLRELLPLTNNESYTLGLLLGLPIHRMDVVETTNLSPKPFLTEVIIWFLVQAPESRRNWRVIADALSNPLLNHRALAESIKAAHFPNSTPIDPTERDLAIHSSGDVLSDITGMLESCMHSKHCYMLYYGMGHI